MPLYFFDVHDGLHIKDDEGQELQDLDAARLEAFQIASGYTASPAMLGETGGAVIITVRNASDEAVLDIHLAFSVRTRVLQPKATSG